MLRSTGTSHLVAISGLHVGLVGAIAGGLVSMVWRRLRWRTRAATLAFPAPYAAALAALAAAAGYAALAGFNVPAQRAWWMIAAGGIAYLAGRSVPTSAVLCTALGGVLLADPWAVLSAGFWLSFGAVAVILLAIAGWRAAREADAESGRATARPACRAGCAGGARAARRIAEATRVQYAVTIGLAPLTAAWFAQISLSGPFGNAFAIPWVSSVVTPVVLAGIALPAPFDAYAFRLAHAALEPMMTLLGYLADWPAGVFWLRMPDWPVLVLACVGVAWALMPRGWPLRWAAPITWLPLVAPASDAPPPGGFRLTVFDVGQGASVLVETARRTLLFDAGPGAESTHAGARIVAPALHARGIAVIDSLVLSHADADHAGGAPAVYAAADVRQLLAGIVPNSRLWRDAAAAGVADRLPCAAGQRWTWDGVAFTMLWPQGGGCGLVERAVVRAADRRGRDVRAADGRRRCARRTPARGRCARRADRADPGRSAPRQPYVVGRAFPRFGRAARRGISCRLSQSFRASAPDGARPLRGARDPAAAHRSRRRRAVRRRAGRRRVCLRASSRRWATVLDGSVSAA